MYEYITPARLLDKPITFTIIEPLNFAFGSRHLTFPPLNIACGTNSCKKVRRVCHQLVTRSVTNGKVAAMKSRSTAHSERPLVNLIPDYSDTAQNKLPEKPEL